MAPYSYDCISTTCDLLQLTYAQLLDHLKRHLVVTVHNITATSNFSPKYRRIVLFFWTYILKI